MSFINALKNQSSAMTQSRKPTVLAKKIAATVEAHRNPLIVTVDRVLNRNRLDIFFNQKPSEDILTLLRLHNWHFRPSDKAWYHQDNETNRMFCEQTFNASFSDSGDVSQGESEDRADFSDSVTLTSSTNESGEQSAFEIYKQQCDELIAHLGVNPADLALIAVSALHKATFNKH